MNNYEAGDRVFLFGFSRGAYTVRAVASLLKMYGLLPPGNEPRTLRDPDDDGDHRREGAQGRPRCRPTVLRPRR